MKRVIIFLSIFICLGLFVSVLSGCSDGTKAAYNECQRELFELRNNYSQDLIDARADGKRAGYEEGKLAGYNEGKIAGYNEGKIAGYNEGKIAGYREGKKDGYDEGWDDAYRKYYRPYRDYYRPYPYLYPQPRPYPYPYPSPYSSGKFETLKAWVFDRFTWFVSFFEDSKIDHTWGSGAPKGVNDVDKFLVKYQGTISVSEGYYRFIVDSDGTVELKVDGQLRTANEVVYLSEGSHEVQLRYSHSGGESWIYLNWQRT